jgi:hypothetical protein
MIQPDYVRERLMQMQVTADAQAAPIPDQQQQLPDQ